MDRYEKRYIAMDKFMADKTVVYATSMDLVGILGLIIARKGRAVTIRGYCYWGEPLEAECHVGAICRAHEEAVARYHEHKHNHEALLATDGEP